MSKGHGRAQRFVLEVLNALPDNEWVEVQRLAELAGGWRKVEGPVLDHPLTGYDGVLYPSVSNAKVTRSEVESMRRAVKRLAAEGHVELTYLRQDGLNAGRGRGHRLCVRLPTQEGRLDALARHWARTERAMAVVEAGGEDAYREQQLAAMRQRMVEAIAEMRAAGRL